MSEFAMSNSTLDQMDQSERNALAFIKLTCAAKYIMFEPGAYNSEAYMLLYKLSEDILHNTNNDPSSTANATRLPYQIQLIAYHIGNEKYVDARGGQ